MSDLASARRYLATAEQIVDSAGNVVAKRERLSGLRAWVVSQLILDPAGQPLLKVVVRTGQISAQVEVFTPQGVRVAHIKGRAFFGRPSKFTIWDGSGSVIGRIEGGWTGGEFRLLDDDGRLRARGVRTGRVEGTEYKVEIEEGQPLVSPWPELTAAFFLSRRSLGAVKLPP